MVVHAVLLLGINIKSGVTGDHHSSTALSSLWSQFSSLCRRRSRTKSLLMCDCIYLFMTHWDANPLKRLLT
jgi:hypothetical protein